MKYCTIKRAILLPSSRHGSLYEWMLPGKVDVDYLRQRMRPLTIIYEARRMRRGQVR